MEPEPLMTEGEYLQELARTMRRVVVHLRSGEIFKGAIEYYDQRFIRLTREGEPNLFIFKHDIKYFYEE
jgi:host factor-I protein